VHSNGVHSHLEYWYDYFDWISTVTAISLSTFISFFLKGCVGWIVLQNMSNVMQAECSYATRFR